MDWKAILRKQLRMLFIGSEEISLVDSIPHLKGRFDPEGSLGLYLHIPFCRQICPYCPYNKVLYTPATARRYAQAVIKEIDLYAKHLGDTRITSFYIGGGTPTTMLGNGLPQILEHTQSSLILDCDIHMESHPNDLTDANLERIQALGVAHLSVGVEALQDHHLRTLCRSYSVEQVKAALERAVAKGFRCVNADFIFALPFQTIQEVQQAGQKLLELGVDQVSAYPLFTFPFTRLSTRLGRIDKPQMSIIQRRKMFAVLERLFSQAGFERTSVWAFTRRGVPKYCSVTVPRYLGLGASGSTYLDDVLYFNTFNVQAYIAALDSQRLPIALSLELTRRMQMAGWLYWRIYETRFRKVDFKQRFGLEFDNVYGFLPKILSALGFMEECEDEIVLTDRGAYWLHVLQDLFSINYVGRLWGISQKEPWPSSVVL
jgi:coproporphyrinogen III oxidase-like Fe-S oxidoreductase